MGCARTPTSNHSCPLSSVASYLIYMLTCAHSDDLLVMAGTASNHAIHANDLNDDELPSTLRNVDATNVATLAWGAGSTQGYVHRNRMSVKRSEAYQRTDEGKTERPTSIDIGLKTIRSWIFDEKPASAHALLQFCREQLKREAERKSSSMDPIEFYEWHSAE